MPDVAEDNTADEVRHEEYGSENIRASDFERQRVSYEERDNVDQYYADNNEAEREPEGTEKALVLKSPDIIVKAYKLRF